MIHPMIAVLVTLGVLVTGFVLLIMLVTVIERDQEHSEEEDEVLSKSPNRSHK